MFDHFSALYEKLNGSTISRKMTRCFPVIIKRTFGFLNINECDMKKLVIVPNIEMVPRNFLQSYNSSKCQFYIQADFVMMKLK